MSNNGKIFETDFKSSYPKEGFIYRLRDSGSTYGGCERNGLRFSITNMCDYISFYRGHMFCLELKSTLQHSLPQKNITKRQIEELLSANKKEGVHSFIIINFKNKDLKKSETFAISINKIPLFFKENDRKSIPIEWCRNNGIFIPATIKKVHFNYEIETFLKKVIEKDC